MKTLVTGATGFVGSELTRQLLAEGKAVRILRRATSSLDLLGAAADEVEHVLGDVTDPASLETAMKDVTHLYHVAAYVGFGGKKDAPALHRINVEGTAHVINAALRAGVDRLVHTSSIAALGRTPNTDAVIDETATWEASSLNTAYAESKYLAELEVQRGIAEGLDAVLVNPSLVFGVGRPGENTRQIAERVRDGRVPAVPAGGTNVVDVRDVATGHRLAMAHGTTGERYILAGENLRWRTIIDTLAAAFGVEAPRFTLPPSLALAIGTVGDLIASLTPFTPPLTRETARGASRFHQYSHQKATSVLGWQSRPFRETAEHMAAILGQRR